MFGAVYDYLLGQHRRSDRSILSFSSISEFPAQGGSGIIYVDNTTGLSYIWIDDLGGYIPVGGDGNPFDYLQLKTDYTPTGTEPAGTIYWDSVNHTYSGVLEGGVIMQFGQEMPRWCKNTSGVVIPNGKAVSTTDVGGSFTTIAKTDVSDPISAKSFYGVTTQDFAINQFGFVTTTGLVRDIDTSDFDEGAPLFVDCNTPGDLTMSEPNPDCYTVRVGICEYSHQNNGRINVASVVYPSLKDLSLMNGTPLTTPGQFPSWNAGGYFDNDKNINDYALNTTLQQYLKLDQTTPQTTVGRFSLPNIAVATNLIYTDSVNGRVGIGTTNPSQQLEITQNFKLPKSVGSNPYGVIYKDSDRFFYDFSYGLNSNGITPEGGNLFIGRQAGNFTMGSTATASDQSSYNFGIGYLALSSNTLGSKNTAIGLSALRNNTQGVSNLALSADALMWNTIGSYNTAIGTSALKGNTIGSLNTAIGVSALIGITTSNNNLALGFSAGRYISNGSIINTSSEESIFIGNNTRPLGTGQTNQIVIGNNAIGIGSNTITLGDNNINTTALKGNVGIGTTTPNSKLDINGTTRLGNSTTNYTAFDANGHQTMVGTATVFDDLLGDITGVKTLGTGVSNNNTENTLEYTAAANVNDYAYFNYQLSHKRKIGSTVYPHIHFEQTQNVMPNWLIQYRWQRQGQQKTTAWTNYKVNLPVFTYTSGTLNQISYDGGITAPANASLSDIIEIRIIRDTANTSGLFTGVDTYTGIASITSADIHYECDSLGSNTEFTK